MHLTVKGKPIEAARPNANASSRIASFRQAITAAIRGEVYFDEVTRGVYATDASHYQVTPACVVVPVDQTDALEAVRIAGAHGVAITARGGGTSLSGQTTWDGMVLDFSKHVNRLIAFNAAERWVRCEPGLVRDHLNAAVKADGLHFAPDPATTSRACIGGMIGNNTSGTKSILYGKTSDHVLELKVALADGTVLTLGPTTSGDWAARGNDRHAPREAEIYRGIADLIASERDEIRARYPKVMRRVSGYALDALVDLGDQGDHDQQAAHNDQLFSLANLIIGSEGTLGVVLEAKLKLEPLPKASSLVIGHFEDVIASLAAVPGIIGHGPSAVELLDDIVCAEAVVNPSTRDLTDFIEPAPGSTDDQVLPPKGLLICEFYADDADAALHKANAFADDMRAQGLGYAWPVRTDPEGQQRVWQVRQLGLGLISNVPGPVKGQAFIEDACVPIEVLADYIRQVLDICAAESVPISIYAHASVGVIHCRPMLDLHHPDQIEKMRRIADRCFDLVVGYGGSFASEHGDGLVRGGFIERFYGERIAAAFMAVKALFDPTGVMNPGKIVGSPGMDELLRYDAKRYDLSVVPDSRFRYAEQGGFAGAVEQCNGVGACRKLDVGTMCPSFMATRDETHTTRGRANALRLAMTGQLPGMSAADALASDGVHDALSLCLSCKACKTECPNAVDMSRLKADALQHRYHRRGTPMSARMIADLPVYARRIPGWLTPLTNAPLGTAFARKWLERIAGFDARRSLPKMARRKWGLDGYRSSKITVGDESSPRTTVALFADTWSIAYEPGIGRAVVAVLEALGCDVRVVAPGCCQRPAISKGMLDVARERGGVMIAQLDSAMADLPAGTPILAIEPSCASALTDDLPDLLADQETSAALARRVQMIDAFVAKRIETMRDEGRELDLKPTAQRVLLHGHCHHKALYGVTPVEQILRAAGADVEVLDAGCCGMAGSFGYEHADVSMAVAEDRLLPGVRRFIDTAKSDSATSAVCATGTSCREQIETLMELPEAFKPKHWAELLVTGANQ